MLFYFLVKVNYIFFRLDVYSFGLLFYEMCTGEWPVFENHEKVRLIANKEFGRLILWCIEEEPILRPSMEEVIKELERFKNI